MSLRVEEKVGHQDTQASNRRLVLQHLFRSHGHSRAELARLTGLTPATVSSLVASLIDEDLVLEGEPVAAKIGKPSKTLKLNARARLSICVDLSDSSSLRAAALDLDGNMIHRTSADLSGFSGEEAFALTADVIAAAISSVPGPLLGIGIGTPGVVTPTGVVVEANNLGWFDFDLARRLRSHFNIPVSVLNDANAAVLAEYSFAQSDSRNLMAVMIGLGVGAGIIVNGGLYLGEASAAGEIGHIVVEDDGPLCRCGNHGCLETFLSIANLRANASDDDFVELSGRHLGKVLAGVSNILDIHDIIVNDAGLPITNRICEIALSELKARTPSYLRDTVAIRPSKLGEDVVLLGASLSLISQEMGVA